MRIVILGAGALGGLIGARLSQAGEDVTFLEANVARARLLGEEGLFLSEADNGSSDVFTFDTPTPELQRAEMQP